MKKYNLTPEQHADIKNRDFSVYKFTTNGKTYVCYSKLMQYMISDSPILINRETMQPESVERGEILDIYATAYDKGREQFRTEIKPDATVEYLKNGYNEQYNGWKNTSEQVSTIIQKSFIETLGLNSGIRFEFEIYREKNLKEFEISATISQSTEQQKTIKKPPVELSIKYIVEQWRADAREVQIRTRVEKELRKSGIALEPANTRTGTKALADENKLICDKKYLQILYAEFDGQIWESMELEAFLNCMRVEPITKIEIIGKNKDFVKWVSQNIENQRDAKLVPNFGKWFKKLTGKNINYSTIKNNY